jgi:hypothetical protein
LKKAVMKMPVPGKVLAIPVVISLFAACGGSSSSSSTPSTNLVGSWSIAVTEGFTSGGTPLNDTATVTLAPSACTVTGPDGSTFSVSNATQCVYGVASDSLGPSAWLFGANTNPITQGDSTGVGYSALWNGFSLYGTATFSYQSLSGNSSGDGYTLTFAGTTTQ